MKEPVAARPDKMWQEVPRADLVRSMAALKKFGKGRNVGPIYVYADNGNFMFEFGSVRQGFPLTGNWVGYLQFNVQLFLTAKTNLSKDATAEFKFEGETLSLDGIPIARCYWSADRPGKI
jgi:hypothetical protein